MLRSGVFLQSTAWEKFQASLGKTVHRDQALLIRNDVGLGIHYWYCGRAVPDGVRSGIWDSKALFVRFDSPVECDQIPDPRPDPIRAVPAPHDVQPSTTILLNLHDSTENLLAVMHPKTRYNIKVAEKRGVTVNEGGAEAFETFWQLLQSTTERNAFRGHGKEYYQKMLQVNDGEARVFIAVASVDQQPAAAALMLDYAGTRTYLHGASNYALRDAMAPYALHWHLIQEGKKLGLTTYDFWGIAPNDDPHHRLAGVTRFKKGWGGEVIRYPQTQDLILRPFAYKLYRLAHRLLMRS